MKPHNPNCDGSHCTRSTGQVRTLPTGGDSNGIFCHACYRHEIAWRRERNKELGDFAKYDLPAWNTLEPYEP